MVVRRRRTSTRCAGIGRGGGAHRLGMARLRVRDGDQSTAVVAGDGRAAAVRQWLVSRTVVSYNGSTDRSVGRRVGSAMCIGDEEASLQGCSSPVMQSPAPVAL